MSKIHTRLEPTTMYLAINISKSAHCQLLNDNSFQLARFH